MPILILIPAILFIVALFRDSLQKAFLDVFLPLFILFPIYYYWKVAALPPIDVSQAVLVPLGLAILIKEWSNWRPSVMDVYMALFIFSGYHADSVNKLSTASTFELFNGMTAALVPYLAGKLLIEKDNGRNPFLRRMVFLLFVACIISAYEYRMGRNPFMMMAGPLFPEETFAWKTQIRWGFGRVSGPYGQSELAGMMLFTGLVFALYLGYYKQWEPKFRRLAWLPSSKSRWIAWTIGITLFMTQARGPWFGCLAAIPIALAGRSQKVLRTFTITVLVLTIVGGAAYVGFKAYTSGPVTSEAQENATYRAQLMTNYLPIAINGGAWGWGQKFPRVMGQDSIDNEYLFVALTQGWVGFLSLCLLALAAMYHLTMAAIFNPRKNDRVFAFSLLGIMVGLLVTIYTVFLGNQPYELFFLLVGWSQAVRVRVAERPAFAFAQVYT
jgi:hypothetical protein